MQYYDKLSTIRKGTSRIIESYIPLWFNNSRNSTSDTTTVGTYFLAEGTSSAVEIVSPNLKVFQVGAAYPADTPFALEATIFGNGAINYLCVYDLTTRQVVSGSLLSTSSTTFQLLRSSLFSLVPGRNYALSIYVTGGTGSCMDASLVTFT